MQIRHFAGDDYQAVAQISNSLNIVWPERPRTSEGWMETDRNRNPRHLYQRLVAVKKEKVVGFGSYSHGDLDNHPNWFHIDVEVSPDTQQQGVGTALFNQILLELQPFEPYVLRADAFTHLPQGFTFLKNRGFFEAFRETPVHLDIPAFDPSPYASVEAKLGSRGIVIKTLRELLHDHDRDQKVYDLYWEAYEDVPQEDTRIEGPDFEEWVEWWLNHPTTLHDAYFIAVCGDEYIGLSEWGKEADSENLIGGLLGVRRAYRGQGVALGLLLRAIDFARENNLPVLKTCTAIQNKPMQSLFDKLGFSRDSEWLQCQKN